MRAIVAFAAGFFITLDEADHSAHLGLLVFGLYALIEGLVIGVGSLLLTNAVTKWIFVGQGALGVVVGIAALALTDAGLGVLLYTVSVWALLTGFAELYCGIRSRGRSESARDWMVIGGLTVVLALVFLFIQSDSRLAVGLFGAYAVIVGVYVGIGAFTLKFGLAHHEQSDRPVAPEQPSALEQSGALEQPGDENASENHS